MKKLYRAMALTSEPVQPVRWVVSLYGRLRCLLGVILLVVPGFLVGQVYMRPVENASGLALGGAVVAFPDGAAGLNNDAVLGLENKSGIFLSSAIPFGIGAWQTMQFQGFVKTGAADGLGLDVLHSGIDAYREQRFRVLYGRRLGQAICLGGSADVLRVSAPEYGSATTVSFGLSVLAEPLPNIWLGARVQNPLQAELSGTVLPTFLRLGAAWEAASTLVLLAEVEKDIDRPAQLKTGVAYRPVSRVALRLGFRTEPSRISAGAGLQLVQGLELNAASEWHPTLGLTPSVMLVWRRQ